MMKSIIKFTLIFGLSVFTFLASCSEEEILDKLTGGCIAINAIENYSNTLDRYGNDPIGREW